MAMWLRRQVHRDRPDVVLSMLPYSGVVSLAALVLWTHDPVPVMVSEHNVPSLHTRNLRRRERIMYWLARHLYRYAAAVHAVSHPIAGELVSSYRIPPEKIFVVPNPIVPSSTATDEPRREPLAQLRLAFVGRFVGQKRPHLFLEVLRELAQRGVAVEGVMIGDGPLRRSVELRASELDLDVAFLGWQEPWWHAASDLDCLVLTANAEGLAMVLVEAAAAGIPAVASSRALGVADAIVPGITGELALDDSAMTYADAVLAAASLVPLSDVNLQAWLTHFSPASSAATLLTALRTTIADARS
jgi:glycosyltransferase involved in cell wall biosynthesis